MESWSSVFDLATSLFLFALGTQCLLAWIYSLLFLSFLRAAQEPPYFESWTRAWFARAVGLTAILVRFTVPITRGENPAILDGTFSSDVGYSIYQSGKLLANWWLLEGVLRYAGSSACRRVSWVPWLVASGAVVSVAASGSVEDLLIVQSPLVVASSLFGALILLRLAPERRNAGTRIAATALLFQAVVWAIYYAIFLDGYDMQAFSGVVAKHNSYIDLSVDVLLGSGLVVLLLQDVHRRQMAAEAERSRLRAELDRTQRLSSLGTLVSGVAHELNNPLAAILGFAEALESPASDEERVRHAAVIKEQALRCRRIVRGLSTFSGKDSEAEEPIDLSVLIERVMRGFEFELARKRVHVTFRPAGAAPALVGDRFALEQMLANLLANALQASPSGKSIMLSAEDGTDGVQLVVEDEGPGIPPDCLAQIFDPFFTTRAPGEGMGLGLAVVHGIVRAHGGSIRAENRVPHGARFVVSLPRRSRSGPADGDALPEREVPRPPAAERKSLELLVIEDEPLVREMLSTLGARRGWRVSTAASGRAGLEHLRNERARFHVVLCDLRMARPSGIEIHDALAAEEPELLERFVFVTGDLASEEAAAFARRCRRPILRKPFHIHELAARIEEAAAARVAAG